MKYRSTRSAKQRLCTKHYNMDKIASSSGCLNRKKRRQIATFDLKIKTDLFQICKSAKLFIFKTWLLPLFNLQFDEIYIEK